MQNNQNLTQAELNKQEISNVLEYLNNNTENLDNRIKNNYVQLAKDIQEIENLYLKYNSKNEINGVVYEFLEKDKKDLLEKIQNFANDYEKLKEQKPTTKLEKSLFSNIEKLNDCLSKDVKSILKVQKTTDFKEIIGSGRKRVIDITGKVNDKLAGGQNVRQVINDGNKKGVFTIDETFDYFRDLTNLKNKYLNAYPEFKDFFKKFITNNDRFYSSIDVYSLTYTNDGPYLELNYLEGYLPEVAESIKNKNLVDLYNTYIQNPKFKKAFYQYNMEAKQCYMKNLFQYSNQEMEENEVLGDRNTGMSVIAELLGIGNIIAHTESVTLKNGDQMIHGTMMDFAEGKDINHLSMDDIMHEANFNDLDNKDTKKDLATLQILDYICGNQDRNGSNMFYKFEIENDKPVCKGIQGIDNDSSFTILVDDEMNAGKNSMVGLRNLNFIPEDLANKIKTLTPSMMKLALHGLRISDKAINACIERFNALQDVVLNRSINPNEKIKRNKEDATKDSIHIYSLKDDQWDSLPYQLIEEFYKPKNQNPKQNIFATAKGAVKIARDENTNCNYDYIQKADLKASLNYSICNTKFEINNQKKLLKKGNSIFRGTSPEYEAVRNSMDSLLVAQNNLSNDPTNEEITSFCNQIREAYDKANIYLSKKEAQKENGEIFNRYTLNRIKYMNTVKNYLDTKIQSLEKDNKDILEINKKIEFKTDCIQSSKKVRNEALAAKLQVSTENTLNNNVQKAVENKEMNVNKNIDLGKK